MLDLLDLLDLLLDLLDLLDSSIALQKRAHHYEATEATGDPRLHNA